MCDFIVNIIDWINWGALGSFVAAFVALFGGRWWTWWSRPKMRFVYEENLPDYYQLDLRSGSKYHTYRLGVLNEGRDQAKNVSIFIKDVESIVDGTYQLNQTFCQIELVWTHTIQLVDQEHFKLVRGKSVKFSIPSGIRSLVDLGVFGSFAPTGPHLYGEVVFNFSTVVYTTYGRLHEGHYRFTLVVAGSNFRPVEQKVEIKFQTSSIEEKNPVAVNLL